MSAYDFHFYLQNGGLIQLFLRHIPQTEFHNEEAEFAYFIPSHCIIIYESVHADGHTLVVFHAYVS